jgi:SAM-dependent methyltransferase
LYYWLEFHRRLHFNINDSYVSAYWKIIFSVKTKEGEYICHLVIMADSVQRFMTLQKNRAIFKRRFSILSGQAKHCKGRILEAMVGSGRVMIPLLESGLIVDAVDYSPEMLASCRHSCEERGLQTNLYESSLPELSLPNKYEAIIIPCGSFLLIEDREESLKALRKLYEHLEPGGRLMLDLFLPDSHFEVGRIETSIFHLPDGDMVTLENKLVEVDFFNQYEISHLKYEKWRTGNLIQTELQRFDYVGMVLKSLS